MQNCIPHQVAYGPDPLLPLAGLVAVLIICCNYSKGTPVGQKDNGTIIRTDMQTDVANTAYAQKEKRRKGKSVYIECGHHEFGRPR
jgi:hypothetical protein